MRRQKKYPKDIGKRFCKTCAKETFYRWSHSRNTYVCESCDYEEAMMGVRLLDSEYDFLKRLTEGKLP